MRTRNKTNLRHTTLKLKNGGAKTRLQINHESKTGSMKIVEVHDRLFVCDINEEKQIRLSHGVGSNNVFITSYNPKMPNDQTQWKTLHSEPYKDFVGNVTLKRAFANFLKHKL